MSVKLSLYFAGTLLLFAIIIGGVFVSLFRSQSLDANKAELENRAVNIAENLPLYIDDKGAGMGGFSMYLRVIGDVAGTDVWIVDADLNLITGGRGNNHTQGGLRFSDLPSNAEQLIQKSFTGVTAFSEDFSNLLSESTLTVGAPIFDRTGEVIGVVLLHSPIQGVNEAIYKGILILIISIVLALIASFILSILFSRSFTKPLSKMKKTALQLADGQYTVKTNIMQDDEIGELAHTLDVLAERLDEASHESEQLEIMRNEFVANISHELKTPITVIRGSLEALIDEVVTDPIKIEEYHMQMLNESKFLQRLVGDLLDLSKLQSMDFKIEKTEISVCEIIDDVTRSTESLAKKAQVNIVVTKDSDHCKILGDYGRVRQMIMIIVDNAIKFSASNETVTITLVNNRLVIKDNGIGIQAEHLPYIFDRFYKSRSEHNKTGTGLGLAIAKKIADRHQIRLTVESIEGEGSSFILTWD